MSKKIAIIGLGGVGGYFGFKINEANTDTRQKITFVARGATYEVVREQGLTLHSPEHARPITRPDHVTDQIASLTEQDLVLICVKEYDLEPVCRQLLPVVKNQTILLPLMNGVDIYDRVRAIIPGGAVLPACVYVASHQEGKGVVTHRGNTGKIILGRDPQRPEVNLDWVVALLQDSGADITFQEDAWPAIWTKFVFIASFGMVTARYHQSIGQVEEDPLLRDRAIAIMEEILSIAHQKGIVLAPNIIELTLQKATTFPYDTPTSLQLDVHSGKGANELELFAGAILRYGKELDLDTRSTRAIYSEIKSHRIGA